MIHETDKQFAGDPAADNRNLDRDSFFLLADVRFLAQECDAKVRVRNLSAGGMMADGDIETRRGEPVTVTLRNIGEVHGNVAWAKSGRFGVSFDAEIDPNQARKPVGKGDHTPRFTKPLIKGTRSLRR